MDWCAAWDPPGRRKGKPPPPSGGASPLAAALAVNNAGTAWPPGCPVSPPAGRPRRISWSLLAAPSLGRALGDKLAGRLLGKYALPSPAAAGAAGHLGGGGLGLV